MIDVMANPSATIATASPAPNQPSKAMHAHPVNPHQRRLRDEEDDPRRERGAVKPKKQRPWRASVEETGSRPYG